MEFSRQTRLDDAYSDMHGFKPKVSYRRIDNNAYEIQLIHNNRTVVLRENMKKGLTDFVTLTFGGAVTTLKSMYEAELEANKILKG